MLAAFAIISKPSLSNGSKAPIRCVCKNESREHMLYNTKTAVYHNFVVETATGVGGAQRGMVCCAVVTSKEGARSRIALP